MPYLKGGFLKISIPGLFHCHGTGEMYSPSTSSFSTLDGYTLAFPADISSSTWAADVCADVGATATPINGRLFIGALRGGPLFGGDVPLDVAQGAMCFQHALHFRAATAYEEEAHGGYSPTCRSSAPKRASLLENGDHA